MKWKNKKFTTLLISAILLSSFISYQLVLSSVPASGPYYLDVPFGTASFYVGKFDNGTTYMVEGDTWQCIWWSTDSSAIINACIGNLTSGGSGGIFVRVGDYTLTDTISVTTLRGLVFSGEGSGMDGDVTRFIAPSGKPAFTLNGSAYGQALHMEMSNIEIKGDKSSGQIGIELDTVHISTFRNMEFWNLDEAIRLHEASHYNTFDTMKIYNVNTGVYDRFNNYMNTYRNLWMSTITDYGYYQPSTGGSNHVYFDGFGVDGGATAHGIYIDAGAVNVHVKWGYFVDVGTDNNKTAIYFKGLSTPFPMKQCSIEDTYVNRCGYGIRTDYVDGLTVQNCRSLLSNQTGAEFSANTKRLRKISNYFDSETDNSIEDVVSFGASWTVFNDGTYTCMQDSTGSVTWRSTNSGALINACVGNLTSGRTWQETVYVKGNFTADAKLQIPSYTKLIIDGKISLANSVNDNLIENSDQTNGNTQIEIIGGTLYGNKGQQTGGNAIDFRGVTDSHIANINISSFKGRGVYLYETTSNVTSDDNEIISCHFEYMEYQAIRMIVVSNKPATIGCKRNRVIGNSFTSNNVHVGDHYGAVHLDANTQDCIVSLNTFNDEVSAIEIDSAFRNVISTNTINKTSNTAIIVYQGTNADEQPARWNNIIGNIITGSSKAGVLVGGSGASNKPYWNKITSNVISFSGIADYPYGTIVMEDAFHTTVYDNTITNNTGNGIASYGASTCGWNKIEHNFLYGVGINIGANSDNCTVIGNTILSATTGINVGDNTADYTIVLGNFLMGCTTAISDSGTNTITSRASWDNIS